MIWKQIFKSLHNLQMFFPFITAFANQWLPLARESAPVGAPWYCEDAVKVLYWDDKGYLVDSKRTSNLRFGDDIVLISTSPAEVEEVLKELNATGMKIGLDMNMLNVVTVHQRELNMGKDLAHEIAYGQRGYKRFVLNGCTLTGKKLELVSLLRN
ncbi:unnamed protein product [Heligmosomoides polygyrus]|uniref:Reverse transcriptase domain-containing protein n=1 Tax=Heligmosomoides polygyrus TaxID=6339 RepID=A0A183F734_HELPZ|nr:unnamed protein product [Heligmosomoides polygyrus]